MATTTTTAGMALGNIPLSTLMVDKDAVVDIVSGEAEEILSGVQEIVDTAISTVYKPGGGKTAAELTSALLVAANEGYVYNLTTDATTTADWAEGAGKTILAGTDVAVIKVGTAYKFNAMAARDASVVRSVTVNGGTAVTPTSGTVALSGIVTKANTDTGLVLPDASGTLGFVGVCGITTSPGASGVVKIDGSSIAAGVDTAVAIASGAASGLAALKNFSQITVDTSGEPVVITPSGNADTSLRFRAGDNVSLSVDTASCGMKTVIVSATVPQVPVTDGKISGGSSLLSGTTIVIPVASTTAQGVTQLANSVSTSTSTAITPSAVSGAVSGVLNTVSGTLNNYVSGGTLHDNLVNKGLSNPGSSSNNTIYGLIAALHASDTTTES